MQAMSNSSKNNSARAIVLAVLLSLAVVTVFKNTLRNGFVWDDEQFIQRNVYLTSSAHLPRLLTQNIVAGAGVTSNLYRPLQSLTHFLDVRLWGYQSWGHHLTNLILHAGATLAVYWWLTMLAPPLAAATATALFALHPLQSEAVAYVSGRGDLLGILFLCLGLALFQRHRWLSLVCTACAVLSKESLALFPVFLWLSEQAARRPIAWRRHLPFWILSAVYVLLRLTLLNFQNTLNFYQASNILTEHPIYRLWTYLTTLPEGLRLWFWPVDLHHERAWAVFTSLSIPRVAWSAAGVAAWLGLIAACWKRSRMLAVGLFWFVVATLPTSNLLVLINALFYDHWFLLPGLGLALIVCRWCARWPLPLAVCAVLIAIGALNTRGANRVWQDAVSLNSHILRYEPDNAKVHHNLGMALVNDGRLEEGSVHYRQAIQLSGDTYPQSHHNLARVYEQQGHFDLAAEEYHKALALQPSFYQSAVSLGWLAVRRGEVVEAAKLFQQALAAYPYAAEAYLGLAQLRYNAGDLSGARAELERGLTVVADARLTATLARLKSVAQ